jgi:hypothetical protein
MKKSLKLAVIVLCLNVYGHQENTEASVVHADKPKQLIKVALLLDTSNSMDGLINQAKTQLWEIVNELSFAKCGTEQPELLIALYEYGNDRLEASDGYIRQILGFVDDLDEISKELFALRTNGGSEYCGQVIQTSLENLNWGNNDQDLKLIFIAGNEAFTQGKVQYKEVAQVAKENDISINTIFCGNYETGIAGKWQEGAKLTEGDYMNIDQNQKTIHIATPFDKVIIELNSKLNNTYIRYGSLGRSKLELQKEQDKNAQELDEVVIVKRSVSKSSNFYKNSIWDLVDAMEEDGFELKKIDKKSLPDDLKILSNDEIKKIVAKKRKERSSIQAQIHELNIKRNKFIAQKQLAQKGNNSLENALISSLKNQALKKNFSWEK